MNFSNRFFASTAVSVEAEGSLRWNVFAQKPNNAN